MAALMRGLSVAALLALQQALADPIAAGTFASPFGSFDANGRRRVPGWRAGGSARVKMGAVSLALPQAGELGTLWSLAPVNLKGAFSLESKFRLSGFKHKEAGESVAWMVISDSSAARTEAGSWFGVAPQFEGIALVLTTDHADAEGDARKDVQKLTLYANNNSGAPTELGSCQRPFYYDESRDDFLPSLASTIRVSYDGGRIIIDVDPRNTQRWYRCLTTSRINTVIPDGAAAWRERALMGAIARTGAKASRFDVTTFRLYDKAGDAAELAAPDWNADGGDRALKIAHQLEHSLFEVKESIEAMLTKVAGKAERDVWRIAELEDKLAHSAFNLMESRLGEVETRLTSLSKPILDARVRQAELIADHKLNRLKTELHKGAGAWVRPFVVILMLLGAFAYYTYREFRSMNKWNRNLM